MLRRAAHLLSRTMSSSPASIKLQYAAHGPPRDVLRAVAAGDPPAAPPPGHAVVRWTLAAVNWSDVNTIEVEREGKERMGGGRGG